MIDVILQLAPAWAEAHAPALIVLLPLLAAPVTVIQPGNGRIAWVMSIIDTGRCTLSSLILLA
ncbi:MAG: monovalent cation/H+ antiporter subunit D family protein, partial [Henriciella sp.]